MTLAESGALDGAGSGPHQPNGTLMSGWKTTADIVGRATASGRPVTETRVCQVAALLGLDDSKNHTRVVDGVRSYSGAAVGLIEREIMSRGGR
jgi:hypothetical protein